MSEKKKERYLAAFFYLSDVALRMEDDDVKFWGEEAGQRDGGTQTDGDAHAGDPQRQMAGRAVNRRTEANGRRRNKKGKQL